METLRALRRAAVLADERSGRASRIDSVSARAPAAHERGGTEVSTCRLRFPDGTLRTLMQCRPDGEFGGLSVERD